MIALLCPGGTMEISRWSSEAKTTGSPSKTKCAPDGAPENVCKENARTKFPPPPPGRMLFGDWFLWYSLAALARPPANFRNASGVFDVHERHQQHETQKMARLGCSLLFRVFRGHNFSALPHPHEFSRCLVHGMDAAL